MSLTFLAIFLAMTGMFFMNQDNTSARDAGIIIYQNNGDCGTLDGNKISASEIASITGFYT